MKLKKIASEYWRVFWANAYDDTQKDQNMKSVQTALLLMTVFSLVMSVMNVANGNTPMLISSGVLFVLFLVTSFLCRKPNWRAPYCRPHRRPDR